MQIKNFASSQFLNLQLSKVTQKMYNFKFNTLCIEVCDIINCRLQIYGVIINI
jgi:hypothetical protein